MNWSIGDFIVAGVLLAMLGVAGLIFVRLKRPISYRLGFVAHIIGSVLLFWAGGAVGLIGDADNPANLYYLVVLLVGVVGGVYGRFSPDAMKKTLLIMAIMQVAIGSSALALGWGSEAAKWPWDVIAATIAFALIWLLGAFFFRKAENA